MDRIRRGAAVALGSLAVWPPLWAQARRFAALSLVGDKIELVLAQFGIGSNIDRNSRRAIEDAQSGLDSLVLKAVDQALQKAEPGAPMAMLSLPGSVLYDKPERLFDGRQIALPGAVVDALIASKATHLIVLSKLRDAARVPLADGFTGIGTVRGLGFYLDNDIRIVLRDNTGAHAPGVLAPFVYLRMTLVDVQSGDILREEAVRAMEAHFTASNPNATVPWDALSGQQKIDALQRLIDRSIGDAAARLLS
jgi:hypothetical protein